MIPLNMLNELFDIFKSASTLITLPGVSQLVPHSVGCEDGLAGELLVTVLAGVGHVTVVGGGEVLGQLTLAATEKLLAKKWAGEGLRSWRDVTGHLGGLHLFRGR